MAIKIAKTIIKYELDEHTQLIKIVNLLTPFKYTYTHVSESLSDKGTEKWL